MRIALINEGTYPVAHGGVSTWCDQLISRIPEHEFHLVTLVGGERSIVWDVPDNVADINLVPLWDPIPRVSSIAERKDITRLRASLGLLWQACLPDTADEPFESRVDAAVLALRSIAQPTAAPLMALLPHTQPAQLLMAAWQAHRVHDPSLPGLTLAEAARAAELVTRCLGAITHDFDDVDIVHAASNGPSSLVALARHWYDGTPFLLTEHGVFLRERYLALASQDLPWCVRSIVAAFLRIQVAVAYREAAWILPVSDFNGRWERRLGARPERIRTIHNGVNTARHSVVETEPEQPTVTFVGRIDPLKDLHTLIAAFAVTKRQVPAAKLRLFGPTPPVNVAYREGLEQQIAELGLGDAVTFEGSVPSSRIASEAGHVVALSSISEGLPFTVMEAMMHGRATVNTDVGGVAEVVGADGSCGIVVPPREPQAFGEALAELLLDDDRRRQMGVDARARAMEHFTEETFVAGYRDIYAIAARRPEQIAPVLQLGSAGPSAGSSASSGQGTRAPERTLVPAIPRARGWARAAFSAS